VGVVVVLVGVVLVAWIGAGSPGLGARASDAGGSPLDPSVFAPGSCAAFPPTGGDRHETVFLDAGHGGIDPGAVGQTSSGAPVEEATLTLPVELDAAALLRARGFRVVVSRTTASTVLRLGPADLSQGALSLQGAHDDVAARARCANLAGAAVLVGIYFDSGGSPSDAGSLTTYDTARPFAAANENLAQDVQRATLAAMNAQGWGIPDAGVVPDSQEGSVSGDPAEGGLAGEAAGYGHLLLLGPPDGSYNPTPSAMPGAVIEPMFVTDPFEATIAASQKGQEVMASGIASGIEQFLGPAPPPSSG
jgi:N-acetylmuramoyl-L-alanine amidase